MSTRTTASSRTNARERLLSTACNLFYARGLRAVGVDTLIAESGVAKATFYKHFPAKDDLIVAYLDTMDEQWMAAYQSAAEAAGDAPADRLVGAFDAIASARAKRNYRGCPFQNAAGESPSGSAAHARIAAHKTALRSWVKDIAGEAGVSDADALARGLTVLMDGALAAGVVDKSAQPVTVAKEMATQLVAAAPKGAKAKAAPKAAAKPARKPAAKAADKAVPKAAAKPAAKTSTAKAAEKPAAKAASKTTAKAADSAPTKAAATKPAKKAAKK